MYELTINKTIFFLLNYIYIFMYLTVSVILLSFGLSAEPIQFPSCICTSLYKYIILQII